MYQHEIQSEIELAARLEHPERLLRITLDCGHLKLTEARIMETGGIGWSTGCHICPADPGQVCVRKIVNVEETGVL